MKIKIYKVQIVDVEIELSDFLNSKQCLLEFIDEINHPSYTSWDGYPSENFIMVYQEYDSGELNLHEVGYVLCDKEPDNLKDFVITNIDKFSPFDN